MLEAGEIFPCVLDPRKDCPLTCGNNRFFTDAVRVHTNFSTVEQARNFLRSQLKNLSPKQVAFLITNHIMELGVNSPTVKACVQHTNLTSRTF